MQGLSRRVPQGVARPARRLAGARFGEWFGESFGERYRAAWVRLVAALGPSIAALLPAAGDAVARDYAFDARQSDLGFEVRYWTPIWWKGRFARADGSFTLDRDARTGRLEVAIDAASIEFGVERFNEFARGPDFFDTDNYPRIEYRGVVERFDGDRPRELLGQMTLRGVTRPLRLLIDDFDCAWQQASGREICQTVASGLFDRRDYGLTAGAPADWAGQVRLTLKMVAFSR